MSAQLSVGMCTTTTTGTSGVARHLWSDMSQGRLDAVGLLDHVPERARRCVGTCMSTRVSAPRGDVSRRWS